MDRSKGGLEDLMSKSRGTLESRRNSLRLFIREPKDLENEEKHHLLTKGKSKLTGLTIS